MALRRLGIPQRPDHITIWPQSSLWSTTYAWLRINSISLIHQPSHKCGHETDFLITARFMVRDGCLMVASYVGDDLSTSFRQEWTTVAGYGKTPEMWVFWPGNNRFNHQSILLPSRQMDYKANKGTFPQWDTALCILHTMSSVPRLSWTFFTCTSSAPSLRLQKRASSLGRTNGITISIPLKIGGALILYPLGLERRKVSNPTPLSMDSVGDVMNTQVQGPERSFYLSVVSISHVIYFSFVDGKASCHD